MLFRGIHRKPKAVREQYAFWSAAGITAAIAFVWIITLQYRLGDAMPSNFVESEHQGAFAQFLGEARTRAAAVFGSVREPSGATTTDAQAATTSEREQSAFELKPRPQATTSVEAPQPREVRITPLKRTSTTTESE